MTQHNQFQSPLRFYGSLQDQQDNANLVEEKTQYQGAVNVATISKKRQEWQVRFRDFIANKDHSEWKSTDWDFVAEEITLSGGPRWEVLCMHTLYQDKNIALGRSLMKYLEEKAKPLSHITSTFYIGLLGETSTSSEQDDETKAVFDHLLETLDFLDPASIEVLVSGLSHTKYYRECVKLIEICRETSTVGSSVLVSTLFGSIRFKDLDLLRSILSMIEETIEPTQLANFSTKLIEACLLSSEEIFRAVMEFYKKHSLLLPLNQAKDIIETFHRIQPNKWRIQTSYIHHRT
ncbi:hypothetical protein ElyMa_004646300 [Elysia marginata]|uniref:Uncharacterized protein n=1 Tax=Elysia marginata TaxID=1093978 RepID=A0AAV4I1X2_9GAST|nr:hypothetical protein ElyMa_004646300 [Elysia marginata]